MRCGACQVRKSNPEIEATNDDGEAIPLCNRCARQWLIDNLEDDEVIGDA